MTAAATLLDRLLAPGALRARYQPIFDISGPRPVIRGAECLARGPEGTNLQSPDLLFAYARNKRAEAEVDRVAIAAALAGVSAVAGEFDLRLHVNVHASTLGRDGGFPEWLLATCRECGVSPDRLVVEVIEHSEVLDRETFQRSLAALRTLGMAIGLDDIGLGRSNFLMIYLSRPSVLKVDRFFVHGMSRDPVRRAVLDAIQLLARELDAEVVAEGVEEPEDLAALRELGVGGAQGYLLARPLTAADLATSCAARGGSA